MSCGKISGTPPTRVDTTYKPAQAASRMAMPNDSVKDVFMNIVPRDKTYCSEIWVELRSEFRWVYSPKGHHYDVLRLIIRHDLARNVFRASGEDQSTWGHHRLFFLLASPWTHKFSLLCRQVTYQRRILHWEMQRKYEEQLLQVGRYLFGRLAWR